jgi:L-glyceraldehyde 3-phosphate reductase
MAFSADRYDRMRFRRCGRSGLLLPAVSLGGSIASYDDHEVSKRIVFTAFDLGITHIDLANNYGSPTGASETLFGDIVSQMPREELVISTKAGYRMWPGPYGDGGGRKYLIESCDASLKRLRLDHVDIFYSHRMDPDTPLEETLGALETLVRQGKTLYTGISNYTDPQFSQALAIVGERRWAPIAIQQRFYHLLAREAEQDVLPTAARGGVGVIAHCPLARGLLTSRYFDGIPGGSRASLARTGGEALRSMLTQDNLARVRRLDAIAKRRGQTLAQMSLAWLLKDPRVTSVLIGASSPEQVRTNAACLDGTPFTEADLADIDAACA